MSARTREEQEAINAAHWARIMADVKADKHPSATFLAETIIACGVPANSAAALYVARRLGEYNDRRPRSRSRQQILATRARYRQMLTELRDWKATDEQGYRRALKSAGFLNPNIAPSAIAQDALADELGIAKKTLQGLLYGPVD